MPIVIELFTSRCLGLKNLNIFQGFDLKPTPPLQIFTDGACRGNPGVSSVGIIIKKEGEIVFEQGFKIPYHTTNNVAEYLAVFSALMVVKKLFARDFLGGVSFYCDSLLLVNQMNGVFKIRDPKMKSLHDKIYQLLSELKTNYSFTHILREKNSLADAQANLAIDKNKPFPDWFDLRLITI